MRLVCNREDAKDIVQETLLAAWWNMPGFRGGGGIPDVAEQYHLESSA